MPVALMSGSVADRKEDPGAQAVIPVPTPDIAAAAARVGTYVWLTARVFEVVGAWARTESDLRAKREFAGLAARFAWQSGEWHRRLPRLREADLDALIRPPGDQAEAWMRALGDLGDRAARRTGLVELVACLDAVYAVHAAAGEPWRDGPVLRTLERCRCELAEISAELATTRSDPTGSRGDGPEPAGKQPKSGQRSASDLLR